jgi:hypothetical protein
MLIAISESRRPCRNSVHYLVNAGEDLEETPEGMLATDIVIAMSPTATSLRAIRNRAIILLGFAGAFRHAPPSAHPTAASVLNNTSIARTRCSFINHHMLL